MTMMESAYRSAALGRYYVEKMPEPPKPEAPYAVYYKWIGALRDVNELVIGSMTYAVALTHAAVMQTEAERLATKPEVELFLPPEVELDVGRGWFRCGRCGKRLTLVLPAVVETYSVQLGADGRTVRVGAQESWELNRVELGLCDCNRSIPWPNFHEIDPEPEWD